MKASNPYWKAKLLDKMPNDWASGIDDFETVLNLRKKNKLEEKLFAETRLRRGAYGQRYDNGQRYDGQKTQILHYPDKNIATKGPNTLWHAPGMLRIKVPYGGLNTEQADVLADLAEEYSDGIAHVTTRQDIQLHFIHIDDTPSILRRLASVGITTQEACGNSVRNVTACPKAGCCKQEIFDITPYAKAMMLFLLGHHDVQDFGRKFKIAFSACKENACGLTNIHDLGLIAKTKLINGKEKRGFEFYVGGGLGAVPYPAKLLEEFVPEEELLSMTQAICRVFSRLGEKKNRARARVKFLVAKVGIDEFRCLVREERAKQPEDKRWIEYLKDLPSYYEEYPLNDLASVTNEEILSENDEDYLIWKKQNAAPQKQSGYCIVTIKLPLGDITTTQLRDLSRMSNKYINNTMRTTIEQNIVLRWVREVDLPAIYADLKSLSLAESGASHITDIVACPGTDTCKLGISASRGLAMELRKSFKKGELANLTLDDVINKLHIKISGCFNSCAQHHVADIGFYGVNRKISGHAVPHFQVVLGGQWEGNGASFGLPVIAIPSKNIPKVVHRLANRYKQECKNNESFTDFVSRLGKAEVKSMLSDLAKIPSYEEERYYYSDWGDPREYSIGDMGVGECAGEVVSRLDMDLAAVERKLFDAQLLLEKGDFLKAGELSIETMLDAARSLVKTSYLDIANEPQLIADEFRTRFYDTKLFFDPYAGGKFASYLFSALENTEVKFDAQKAHERVEEASLFVEASHACSLRMSQSRPATV